MGRGGQKKKGCAGKETSGVTGQRELVGNSTRNTYVHEVTSSNGPARLHEVWSIEAKNMQRANENAAVGSKVLQTFAFRSCLPVGPDGPDTSRAYYESPCPAENNKAGPGVSLLGLTCANTNLGSEENTRSV